MIPANQKLSYQELERELQSANEQLARYKAEEVELPELSQGELTWPIMKFLRSIPGGYQIHLEGHTFIPLKRYLEAAANYIDALHTFAIAQVAGRKALKKLVKDCQDDLAKWIVPDSGILDHDVLNTLLGRLDGTQARAALAAEGKKHE